jgi:Phage integrase, N-terminal SAM-like domain
VARSAAAPDEWLTRIEHSIKPSMAQNWRNYANYYVKPYIGERDVQDIDGAVCDALYAKLLAEGRVKAKSKPESAKHPVHVRRVSDNGKVQPCRPYRYDTLRCYRTHAEDDPLIGQPIESAKPIRQHRAHRRPARQAHARADLPAVGLITQRS